MERDRAFRNIAGRRTLLRAARFTLFSTFLLAMQAVQVQIVRCARNSILYNGLVASKLTISVDLIQIC